MRQPQLEVSPPPRLEDPLSLRLAALSPQLLGMLDQAIVSAGNFTVTWMLARKLAVDDFGAYVVLMGLILTLNAVQYALVVFPFTIRYATADLIAWQSGVVRSLVISLATLSVQIPIAIGGCLYINHPQFTWAAILTLAFWQAQEVLRRAMFQRALFRHAIGVDCIRYAIPALLIVVLPAHLLSAQLAIDFAAAASAAAFLSFVAPFARRPDGGITWAELKWEVKESWRTGRSVILYSASGNALAQGSVWILSSLRGLSAASQYQAINSVLGIINPAVQGIGTVMYPAVARAYSEFGSRAAIRKCLPYVTVVGAIVLSALACLILVPGRVLVFLYGSQSPYATLLAPLRIAAGGQMLMVCFVLACMVMLCIERGQVAWRVQTLTTVACIAVMIPVTRLGGLQGCLITLAVFYGFGTIAAVSTLSAIYRGDRGTSVLTTAQTEKA